MNQFNSVLCSLFFIAGCGGGGGSESANTPPPVPVITPAPTPLFDSQPIVLYDAVSYYPGCSNPNIQFVIPVDINSDSYSDFIVHFWCESDQPSFTDTTPTEDSVVAYVSDMNGNYVIDNYNVFGSDDVKLGGASRKYARGDFNSDGKDDFAFAMNWEDGRSTEDPTTNYAEPAVLMSNDNGYTVLVGGFADWGHSVAIKDDTVLFAGHTSQAYKYVDGDFVDVREQYTNLSYASFLMYDDYVVNSFREYYYNDNGDVVSSAQGLEVVLNNQTTSRIFNEEVFDIQYIGWNDQNNPDAEYSRMGVYNINGRQLIHGMTTEMCRLDDMIVATINGAELIDGELEPGGYYTDQDFTSVIYFSFYTISDSIILPVDVIIDGEEPNHNFNFHDCVDVNGDGSSDIVAQVFSEPWQDEEPNGGVPEVYISDGMNFYNLDTSEWPVYSDDSANTQGYLHDVDSSGTFDLVMFPLISNNGANIEIYTSNKSLTND